MAKTKVHFEYPMHCQSEILYEYLASAEDWRNGLRMMLWKKEMISISAGMEGNPKKLP